VQLTPLARPRGWARFTRHTATAYWSHGNPQPSDAPGNCDSWRSTGQPHAVCLAPASCRRPPRSRRLPAAQLTPGVRRRFDPAALRSDVVRPVEQAPSENRSLRVSRGKGFYVNQNMCKIYLQE